MKVLIVENVKLFQVIIANLFETAELDAEMTDTGAKAISFLQQEKVDVICVSMYLSDIDGIELCKQIRQIERYFFTPIILFTSEENQAVLKKAMSAGITEIFNKQDMQQLVTYIKRFTAQYQPIDAHVLYVEDMLSQRAVVTAFFESYGITVDGCSSGEDAWDKYQQNAYDLVVTDIVLEGVMSGIGLVNRIRRLEGNKGDVPILAVTAFDDVSRRIELFHLGVSDYVSKPVGQEEIVARARNLINSFRAVQEQLNLISVIFENSIEGVFIADHNKKLCSVNKAFVVITGLSEAERKGLSPLCVNSGNGEKLAEVWATVDQEGAWEGRLNRQHKSGKLLSEWLNLIHIKNAQGIITHYIGRIHSYKER